MNPLGNALFYLLGLELWNFQTIGIVKKQYVTIKEMLFLSSLNLIAHIDSNKYLENSFNTLAIL